MDEATREAALKASERRTIERAKQTPPDKRDLLETLLAADVPFDWAISLIADEKMRTAQGVLAEYAAAVRADWASRYPEGSETRLQLEAVANLLHPESDK